MVIAPKGEANLFSNRDKFDIVAVCDQSSTTFGGNDSALSILVRVINEQAFRKYLKRMPMLLVGGVEAWKHDLGESEVVHGDGPHSVSTDLLKSQPSVEKLGSPLSMPSPKMPSPKNPFLNGLASSPSLGSVSNGIGPPLNPFRSPVPPNASAVPNVNGDHKTSMSLDQTPSHSRYGLISSRWLNFYEIRAGRLRKLIIQVARSMLAHYSVVQR